MHYNIYVTDQTGDGEVPIYGVEIQPPLTEVAAAGLCHVLAQRFPEEANRSQLAQEAHVVRHDKAGTALSMVLNPELNTDQIDERQVAREIAWIIDPADRNQVVFGGDALDIRDPDKR